MRGEEAGRPRSSFPRMELPPHARRREPAFAVDVDFAGITSACAEKSGRKRLNNRDCGNYLRMRGEERSLTSWPA